MSRLRRLCTPLIHSCTNSPFARPRLRQGLRPGRRLALCPSLAPDGPAERGGPHTQDVITAIDGKPLRFANDHEVMDFFTTLRPGQTVTFTVVRSSGKQKVRVVALPMTDKAY